MTLVTNPCLQILNEITPTSNYIPKKKEYLAWYKTHYKTITQQPYNDFFLQELIWAFQEFKILVSFLEHEQTIIEANNRYKLLDQENEEEVIEWLLDYENVYEYVEHFYCSHFEWEEGKIEGDKIVVSKELGIKIELSDSNSLEEVCKQAVQLAIKNNEDVVFEFNEIEVIVTPKSDCDKLIDEYIIKFINMSSIDFLNKVNQESLLLKYLRKIKK